MDKKLKLNYVFYLNNIQEEYKKKSHLIFPQLCSLPY